MKFIPFVPKVLDNSIKNMVLENILSRNAYTAQIEWESFNRVIEEYPKLTNRQWRRKQAIREEIADYILTYQNDLKITDSYIESLSKPFKII